MPTNEERREVAARLRDKSETRWLDFYDLARVLGVKEGHGSDGFINMSDKVWLTLADLIEPEPICIANITFTAEQQEELFQRVMKELRANGCPNCGAKVVDR